MSPAANTTRSDRIRELLRAAGVMTFQEIFDALPDTDNVESVRSYVNRRAQIGEFLVTIVDGKPNYSINPDFKPLSTGGHRPRGTRLLPTSPASGDVSHEAKGAVADDVVAKGPKPVAPRTSGVADSPDRRVPQAPASTAAAPEPSFDIAPLIETAESCAADLEAFVLRHCEIGPRAALRRVVELAFEARRIASALRYGARP
jgi:hypothetical protein